MDKISKVELVLENCEVITFDIKEIEYVLIDDVISQLEQPLYCDMFFIELNNTANRKYKCYGMESDWTSFERLTKHHDIAQVYIYYDDKEAIVYHADYDEGDDDRLGAANINQKTKIVDDKLYILVQKNGVIEDYIEQRKNLKGGC